MIESARFTNVNGMYVDFNTNIIPFNNFTTEVDTRFTEKNRSQEHGIYPGDTYFGKRLFHATGDIFADNSAQYIQRRFAMVGALMPRPQFGRKIAGTLDLLFTGMAEHLTSDCTIEGYPEIPFDGVSPARSSYQVNWKAFDPRLYGAWQVADIAYDPNWLNIGGRAYNKTYNKTYSTTGSQGDQYVVNSGNFDTYPILTIFGPVTGPIASLFRSDGMTYHFALPGLTLTSSSESVVVDLGYKTVTRNDGTNLYNYATGDWWMLEPTPMTNLVRFAADSIAIPAHMTVQWRNAYML
jgi:hypothetical protein